MVRGMNSIHVENLHLFICFRKSKTFWQTNIYEESYTALLCTLFNGNFTQLFSILGDFPRGCHSIITMLLDHVMYVVFEKNNKLKSVKSI